MKVAAKLYRARDGREERQAVAWASTVRTALAEPIDATVIEISSSGFRARAEAQFAVGEEVSVGMTNFGIRRAQVVHQSGHEYGCRFLSPVTQQVLDEALKASAAESSSVRHLPLAPPEPVLERWSTPIRALIIIGGALLLWGAILAGVYTLI